MKNQIKHSVIAKLERHVFINLGICILSALLIMLSMQLSGYHQTLLYNYLDEKQALERLRSTISETKESTLNLIIKERAVKNDELINILGKVKIFNSCMMLSTIP